MHQDRRRLLLLLLMLVFSFEVSHGGLYLLKPVKVLFGRDVNIKLELGQELHFHHIEFLDGDTADPFPCSIRIRVIEQKLHR